MFKLAENQKEKQGKPGYNTKGTTVNYILLSMEAQCLMIMFDFVSQKYGPDAVGSLQYDGMLLSKEIFGDADLPRVIEECEKEIFQKMDGLRVKLEIKKMNEGLAMLPDEIPALPIVYTNGKLIDYTNSGLNQDWLTNMKRDLIGLSEVVYKSWAIDNVVMVSEKRGYVWVEDKALWVNSSVTDIGNRIIDNIEAKLISFLSEVTKFYESQGIVHDDKRSPYFCEEAASMISAVNFNIKSIQKGGNAVALITKRLYTYLKSNDFEKTLGKISHLLAIPDKKVIDLRTGDVRERTKDDNFSAETAIRYDPTLSTEYAEKFMLELAYNDHELKDWLIQFVGYCLTASQDDRRIYVAHGCGRNGKSLFFDNVVNTILGDTFGVSLPDDILFKKSASSTSPERACLIGARFGLISENEENERFNMKHVKRLTGSDRITGRMLFENDFLKITNTAKILVLSNNPIHFNASDQAAIDRFVNIPFDNRFENNPRKKDEVLENIEQFFTLFVKGSVEWHKNKQFPKCKRIDLSTQKMIDEIDNSRRFVDERCQIDDQSFKYDRSQMYKDYTLYIKEENPNDWAEFIIPKKDFIKRIDNRFGEATKIG